MKNFVYLILLFSALIFGILYKTNHSEPESGKQTVSAFIRVKNEINTIEACLESIDGVFDKIVIIHSNEPDDGSIDFMNKWCAKREYCEIHEYPHKVFPSHSKEYLGKVKKENTLAAYYNFGLSFFQPDEWVVKIDGDQVYIKDKLLAFLEPFKKGLKQSNAHYGLSGYNSFIRKNELVLYKKYPINGGEGDSFVIKRRNIKNFRQQKYFEIMKTKTPYLETSEPLWFHFMKSLKTDGSVTENDKCPIDEIQYLSVKEKALFEKNIRPLLKNSAYYTISIPTDKEK